MRGRSGASFVVTALLAQLCLAGDCVDGVTPDCSDAAAQCGPDLDGAVLDGAPVTPTDSSTDTGSDTGTTSDSGGGGDAAGDGDAGDQ